MATAMESPMAFPDSPLDPDEVPYPCKGCGQILEEGKAFELAGNRWHIDCFRCNTCGTLLDSDANLLLLGDGSLICNNCTYSCSNCNNKIEDLAILTGDQAFCANCFKCRNCKRKIENLRYARTSQGIFCMDCHEALMARRRKKTAKASSQRSRAPTTHYDKSLPAIPPTESRKPAPVPELQSPYSEDYQDSPNPDIQSVSKSISELQRDVDSRPSSADQSNRDMLTLPSTTFRTNRHSMMSQRSDLTAGPEEFLIPLAFDPTPQPPSQSPSVSSQATPRGVNEERPKDYFTSRPAPTPPQSQASKPATASPHIAYQEKGRQLSREANDFARQKNDDKFGGSATPTGSPYVISDRVVRKSEDSARQALAPRANTDLLSSEKFKLQEAPKTKKPDRLSPVSHSESSTPRIETGDPVEQYATSRLLNPSDLATPSDNGFSTPRLSSQSSPRSQSNESPKPPQVSSASLLQALPKRGDSLDSAKRTQTITRKEVNASANLPSNLSAAINGGTSPTPKGTPTPADLARANGGKVISGPIGTPNSKSIFDTADTPLEASEMISGKTSTTSFVDPRAPPLPPPEHSRSQSVSTVHSTKGAEGEKSPGLPRYSTGGEFTMDEDMARIMGNEEQIAHESFLKRVSNSVRHGRSYSDKTGRLSQSRWPRSPAVPQASIGQEISSPSTASPEHRDELAWFKNELRRERQRTVEREKRIAELETQLESAVNIKQVNSELKEKRSTMVVLDTQKEIVVRELEILTDHLAAAKRTGQPFDIGKMNNTVLRDFAEALERLKNSFAPQIEESIQKRNDLVDEIANLTQMKDKSFMEFEQLSSKNAQLAELNNQLVHQIQGLYKANSGNTQPETKPGVNGLGIYSHHKDKSNISLDSRDLRTFSTDNTVVDTASTIQAGEAEPVTVLQGPHVVNIKKGQAKKFDWRKAQKVGKGVTKGIKGAFSSTQQSYNRELQFAENGAYGSLNSGGQEYSSLPKNAEAGKQGGFGFFGNQKAGTKPNGLYAMQGNNSTPSLLVEASQLFGSDLEQRAEYEKSSIPAIVKTCVEEVESRGMDVEGIYRKSGGNSQVQQVKDWFENPQQDFDLSDPDLDIHAVTSGLKQYFRRLPNPLITYEVYDRLLETTSIQDRDERVEAMQTALEYLPRVHYETLEYLMRHLTRVVQQEKQNLMTSLNIAVVFAPTIMRPESLNRELSDTKMKNEAVTWMVENCDGLFGK